ncbi:MAG: HlyC/CorC family transporter [Verrucomicrobia bacterium]|nr:MAG: HlyC/CorC family transporter [Verrucomicrobiota bacterium]
MDGATLLTLFWKILAVAFLVFLNGFFVAAEFALVKVRDTQLDPLIEQGNRWARVARRVLRNLDASLSACQLGITLASLALGWVGEPIFTALLAPVWGWLDWTGPAHEHLRETVAVVVGFSCITFLHISAGEQAPKWFAIQRPLPVALAVSAPLSWFHRVSWPFIWVLNHASLWMLRRLGLETGEGHAHGQSEEELRLMVAAATRRGGHASLGREIILNAFDLRDRIVRDVMQPRRDIVGFDLDLSIAACLKVAEETRFSRFVLYEEEDLDRTVGVVHVKDLYALRDRAKTARDLLPVGRPLIYLPEAAPLEKALEQFLQRKLHLAIVVDEYGSTEGLITLEDVLEELVGEIQDEFDREPLPLRQISEDEWELEGTVPLHELEELVEQPLEEEGLATVAGWVTWRLGRFPQPGVRVELEHFELEVTETEGPRITRLRLRRRPPPPPAE